MTEAPKPEAEPEAGSLPLKNARHEAFCIAYVGHGNATRAYLEAGYSERGAAQSSHALLRNPDVTARVDNLRRSKWKALHMGTDELLAILAGQARFNMADIVHVTPQGEPYIDLNKATREDMAALTEVTIEDFTDGREVDEEGNVIKRDVRRVKVKAPNKIAAASLLAKNLGLLKDQVEVKISGTFAESMARAEARARKAKEREDADQG